MASRDTLDISRPRIEPLSDDNESSPLSSGNLDDLDDQDETLALQTLQVTGDDDDGGGEEQEPDQEQDQDPEQENSSDVLSNVDTEAETERLFDTPRTTTRHTHVLDTTAIKLNVQRSPTSAAAERASGSGNGNGNGNESQDSHVTSLEDSSVSVASSPPAVSHDLSSTSLASATKTKPQSPTLDILAEAAATATATANANGKVQPNHKKQQEEDVVSTRKRKRSSLPPDPTVADSKPARKRAGSATVGADDSREDQDGDVSMAEDGDGDASGEPSADETAKPNLADVAEDEYVDADGDGESQREEAKPNGTAPTTATTATTEEAEDEPAEDNHEKELERKTIALEQLTNIEKRFNTFRDKYVSERLEQLEQEEAMLRSETPTHPEYLAMMQCIDWRRDDRMRKAHKALELGREAQNRCAVGGRAQIHSQFFQEVREERERQLGALGRYWFHIQRERRRLVTIPEFGVRFPESQAERTRQAVSYNREVSILAGFAKFEGMPAAPDMHGASTQEVDDDFEIISAQRTKPPAPPPPPPPPQQQQTPQQHQKQQKQQLQKHPEQGAWTNPNNPPPAPQSAASHAHQAPSSTYLFAPPHHALQRLPPHPANPASSAPRKRSPLPDPTAHRQLQNPVNPKPLSRPMSTSPEALRAASLLDQAAAAKTARPASVSIEQQGARIKQPNLVPPSARVA